METKPWYASLTIWGTIALTILAVVLPLFGKVDLANALQGEQGSILDLLSAIGAAVASGIAIYGRIRAATRIIP